MPHGCQRTRQHVVARHRIRHIVGGDGFHVALGSNTHQCIVAPHIKWVAVIPHFDQHSVTPECFDEQLERTARSARAIGVQRTSKRAIVGTSEHETLTAHPLGK